MTRIVLERGVRIPMRDGVELAADVYRLDVREPLPVLLQRTPYDRQLSALTNLPADVLRLVGSGYAVVVQDTRGRFGSGGSFTPFVHEAADGADTVAWAARQPWSSGRIGTIGQSYVGLTQWLAAAAAGDALAVITPVLTAADLHDGWVYRGGAFELGFNLLWTLMFLAPGEIVRRSAGAEALERAVDDADRVEELYRRLPLEDLRGHEGAGYYADWLARPDLDEGWSAVAPAEHHSSITAPALNVGGWYDIFLAGTLANYVGMRERGGSAAAREGQRLIVAPWAHGVPGGTFIERSYGLRSSIDAIDLTGVLTEWLDERLRGAAAPASRKRVLVFVMGANVWREEDDWPLPDTAFAPWYLHSRGDAAGVGGVLSGDAPADEPEDTFLYDPADPVPTVGGATFLPGVWLGANAGPRDQRAVGSRRDVLCYTSSPLEHPLEVTGPVRLVLYVSSSARDTDFTGKLVDVAPDGRAEILTDGILRARYRESRAEPSPLRPGAVTRLEVDLAATSYLFGVGHRLRLDVSSSNFPRFDRNTNTGGTIARERIEEAVVARNAIHHRRAYPSHLLLPVIDRR